MQNYRSIVHSVWEMKHCIFFGVTRSVSHKHHSNSKKQKLKWRFIFAFLRFLMILLRVGVGDVTFFSPTDEWKSIPFKESKTLGTEMNNHYLKSVIQHHPSFPFFGKFYEIVFLLLIRLNSHFEGILSRTLDLGIWKKIFIWFSLLSNTHRTEPKTEADQT